VDRKNTARRVGSGLVRTKIGLHSLTKLVPRHVGDHHARRTAQSAGRQLLWLVALIGIGFAAGGLLFPAAGLYRIPFVDATCLLLTGSRPGNALSDLLRRLRP
jgi:hypothetical protein